MKLLTISEVARVLGVRRARAYELAKTGVIPAVHLRRQVRVSDVALREWVAAGGQRLHEAAVEAGVGRVRACGLADAPDEHRDLKNQSVAL